MMLILMAALSLAATEPPPAAEPADDPAATLEGLQQIYDQSCAAREYGAFDDVCDQLRTQLRQARAEAARQAHGRGAAPASHPAPPVRAGAADGGVPAATAPAPQPEPHGGDAARR